MEYNLISKFTLVDIFVVIVIYILAVFISLFVQRNKEFMTPVIYGLMFGNFISLRYVYEYTKNL